VLNCEKQGFEQTKNPILVDVFSFVVDDKKLN